MTESKLIYVDSLGLKPIGRESDQKEYVKNGLDEQIFFYVPDDVYKKNDREIEKYVKENCC